MRERLFSTSTIKSSVRPEEDLSYYFDGDHTFSNEWASITFDNEGRECLIWDLDSSKAGEGRRMVSELVAFLGKGRKILAPITNEPTIDTLLSLGEVQETVLRRGKQLTI